MKSNMAKERVVKAIIYIALIVFALVIIVPVLWVFIAAFRPNSDFRGPTAMTSPWSLPSEFRFDNFVEAWTAAKMGDYFLNSVIVTAVALAVLLVLAIPASYVLARFKFPGRKIINTALMGGLFINVSYIVVPIMLLLLSFDKAIGFTFFMNNKIILSIVLASTALPFTIYLLQSYFVTIPTAFEEAAYVDGAGYFKTMFSIMIPMAKPSVITVILFNFLAFWNEYIVSITLLSGDNVTLPVGIMNLSQASQSKAEYGRLYAGLVLVMLPVLILYMFVQKKLTQGMTAGGVKG